MNYDLALLARLRIEPLDRAKHDRAAFSSGEPRIDTYLKTRAAGLMDVEGTVAWAACLDDTNEIVGFYAMNSHAIDVSGFPPNLRRKLPTSQPIGATFLSNIGTTTAYQGRGVGSFLLADAFRNAVKVADIVGSAFIVLDAMTERAAKLYRRSGFIDLPDPPGRMVIGMKQVRAAVAAAARPPAQPSPRSRAASRLP